MSLYAALQPQNPPRPIQDSLSSRAASESHLGVVAADRQSDQWQLCIQMVELRNGQTQTSTHIAIFHFLIPLIQPSDRVPLTTAALQRQMICAVT